MKEENQDQIRQWLKKLEQESWQLELLVSAFTIFLLIQASGAFDEFLDGILYQYNLDASLLTFVYFFLVLLGLSIKALVVCLIIHLLLRGFWIGTIGLRSVQADVDFEKFNYSDFFTEKLKKKVISLDNLVIMLDEICSLIFSFAFLIISILLAFGLYLLFLGIVGISLGSITNLTSGTTATVISIINAVLFLTIFLTGIVYFIDYFTLGFFKKYRLLSRLYYPFYKFYGIITLSVISKSIYYYLITKFSKKRIRIVYGVIGLSVLFIYLTEYDQYQYFSSQGDNTVLLTNQYDDLRSAERYIAGASIPSNVVSGSFLQLFLRYDPKDNAVIQSNCPDFIPLKKEGFNWRFTLEATDGGLNLTGRNYNMEDKEQLLKCIGSLYQVSINDSIYHNIKYYFFTHPSKKQKGLVSMINSEAFRKGENILEIKKVSTDENGERKEEEFTKIPFWFQ